MKKKLLILLNLIAISFLTGCVSNIFIPSDDPYMTTECIGDNKEWKSDAEKSALKECIKEAYYEGYEYFIILNTEYKTQSSTDTFSIPFLVTGINFTTGDVNTSYICKKSIIMFNDLNLLPGDIKIENPKVYNVVELYNKL